MKKLFYKIEMRMGIIFENEESGELTEERFYYSNGYCIIEDGEIKGILTDDLFRVIFTKTYISMEILLCDYAFDENGEISKEKFKYDFEVKLNQEAQFPCQFIFVCNCNETDETDEKILTTLNFLSKVTDITKQKEIEDDLVELGLI